MSSGLTVFSFMCCLLHVKSNPINTKGPLAGFDLVALWGKPPVGNSDKKSSQLKDDIDGTDDKSAPFVENKGQLAGFDLVALWGEPPVGNTDKKSPQLKDDIVGTDDKSVTFLANKGDKKDDNEGKGFPGGREKNILSIEQDKFFRNGNPLKTAVRFRKKSESDEGKNSLSEDSTRTFAKKAHFSWGSTVNKKKDDDEDKRDNTDNRYKDSDEKTQLPFSHRVNKVPDKYRQDKPRKSRNKDLKRNELRNKYAKDDADDTRETDEDEDVQVLPVDLQKPVYGHCQLVSNTVPFGDNKATLEGYIHFKQLQDDDLDDRPNPVEASINILVSHMDKGKYRTYGLRFHEYGDMSRGCESLGNTFPTRNSGDIGDLRFDYRGIARYKAVLSGIDLLEPGGIIGRSLAIFDRMSNDHLSCCVIGLSTDTFKPKQSKRVFSDQGEDDIDRREHFLDTVDDFKDARSDILDSVNDARDKVMDTLDDFRDKQSDIIDTVKDVKDEVEDTLDDFKDTRNNILDSVKDAADEVADALHDKFNDERADGAGIPDIGLFGEPAEFNHISSSNDDEDHGKKRRFGADDDYRTINHIRDGREDFSEKIQIDTDDENYDSKKTYVDPIDEDKDTPTVTYKSGSSEDKDESSDDKDDSSGNKYQASDEKDDSPEDKSDSSSDKDDSSDVIDKPSKDKDVDKTDNIKDVTVGRDSESKEAKNDKDDNDVFAEVNGNGRGKDDSIQDITEKVRDVINDETQEISTDTNNFGDGWNKIVSEVFSS